MSQVSDFDRLVVSANDELLGALLQTDGVSVVHRSPVLYVLQCVDPLQRALWRQPDKGWVRVFESTYLAPLHSEIDRSSLIAGYFDWLSKRYFNEIEGVRNCKCYELLYKRVQQHRNGATCNAVLDLGCGPGIILSTCVPKQVPLILGCDIGAEVRSRAEAAGLKTISPSELRKSEYVFDVVLSAFVMHYGCDFSATIASVRQNLAESGVWAMNFHKGINLPVFLEKLAGTGLCATAAPEISQYGPILLVTHDAPTRK